MSATSLARNAHEVRSRIARAAAIAGRDPGEVRLVAVSKTFPPDVCAEAVAAGLTDLGENYVGELREKAPELDATWHFLGPLQTGTVRHVARLADWVQSLVPGHAATALASHAARAGRRIRGLIQVDLAGRGTAVAPGDVAAAAEALAGSEGLEICGLMTLPPPCETSEEARPYFRELRALRDGLVQAHPELRELSMGMSLDYEVGVQEGATIVRVGTALFGDRPPR